MCAGVWVLDEALGIVFQVVVAVVATVVCGDMAGNYGGLGFVMGLRGVNLEGLVHLGRVCHYLYGAGCYSRVLLMIFIITGHCDVAAAVGGSECWKWGWGAVG